MLRVLTEPSSHPNHGPGSVIRLTVGTTSAVERRAWCLAINLTVIDEKSA